ncbi:hypothetical protein QQF64_009346 [Cirrhinus molitorella]|uniref:Uncharacterized protein n=1 Tax=Cirrhinus molitorella TaxID=172907 RepID=A0ABR3M0W9_9TELE
MSVCMCVRERKRGRGRERDINLTHSQQKQEAERKRAEGNTPAIIHECCGAAPLVVPRPSLAHSSTDADRQAGIRRGRILAPVDVFPHRRLIRAAQSGN